MTWQRSLLKTFSLYGVTDITDASPRVLTSIEKAVRGGTDIIQLRSKVLSDNILLSLGRKIRAITKAHKKLFFINDRPDLALILGADGVHVGHDDMPVKDIRRLVRRAQMKLFIGKSTHSIKQARAAVADGVDYIGVGPIFQTPTKKEYIPVGLSLIKKVASEVHLPFVCIGGINRQNIQTVLDAGAGRVAVVRALFSAADPREAAQHLKGIIDYHVTQTNA